MSRNGLLALMAEEAIIQTAYKDTKGVWTIGIGHTAAAGGPIPHPGLRLSLHECINLFQLDVRKYEARVAKAIKVPLQQHQFDALTSFDYNTGAIDKGTVDDLLNKGEVEAALAKMQEYIGGGPGLKSRRRREADLFRNGVYNRQKIVTRETLRGKTKLVPQDRIAFPSDPVPPYTPPAPDQYTPIPKNPAAGPIAALVAALIAGLVALFSQFGIDIKEWLPW
jgi:lysozyme